MELNYSEIGGRVASKRRELQLTQEVLAEKTDMSINQISNIENNKSIPSIETILKLCQILKTTPDYLLLGIDKGYNINEIVASSMCQKIVMHRQATAYHQRYYKPCYKRELLRTAK